MTDAEERQAVVEDALLRERLTATFNERGRALGWFDARYDADDKRTFVGLRPDARAAAFEWTMGVNAGLVAAGLSGFNGMELMVASVRGADFIFAIDTE